MRFLIVLIFVPFYSLSQIESNYLIGNWIIFSTPSFKLEDCNDEIIFKENGEYFIYNDCYGDIEYSLIEKGNWKLENNKRLFLKNRNILTNLPSFDTISNLEFQVKYIKPKHFELFSWNFGSFYFKKKADKKCVIQKFSSSGNFDTIIFPAFDCSRVKIGYLFYNDPDAIEVGNKKSISFKKIGPIRNNKEEVFDLLVDFRKGFPLRVIASNPKSKWQINIYYYFDP